MNTLIAADLGLRSAWQQDWAWFAATYPGAVKPLAFVGMIAAIIVFASTAKRPVGRLAGTAAAVLLAVMAVAPGPAIGTLLAVVDAGVSLLAKFFGAG